MKTFKTSELPHAFIHQTAESGKCSASMEFSGDTFYSYSTALAKFITNKKGARVLVVNTGGYSVTTSKHQSWLLQAIPSSMPVVWFSTSERGSRVLDKEPLDFYNHALAQAAECEQKATKARKDTVKANLTGEAQKWLERAGFISEFFGLRKKVDGMTLAKFRKAAELAEKKAAEARKTDAKRHAERLAEQQREYQERYDAWKCGEQAGYFPPNLFPVAFRVEDSEEDSQLVSTLGVRVPLREAQVAYRFITSRKGQEWRENGETCPVGGYAVQSITPAGIVAGCHRITWEEIERLAPVLS